MVKLVFQTADWDDAAQTHNALATEAAFLDCTGPVAEFNRPATLTVLLADPTGAIAQKYDVNAAADSVWIGPGRAYLYDDDDVGDASIFDGRIVRAVSDMARGRLTLECEDWLSQLDDDRLDYDMRETLNASNLRQSEVHTDPDNASFIGPAYTTYAALAGAVSIDGAVEADDTIDANDAGANDMELLPAVPVINDAYCFGFNYPAFGLRVNIGTAGTIGGDYTITWQYSQGGDVWAALAGVTDGTVNFTAAAGLHDVTWTVPADWATDTVGAIAGKYWVKAKYTAGAVTITPIGTQAWSHASTVFDDDMAWVADTYNGKYMVFTGGMAGSITVSTGPYSGSTSSNEGAGDFKGTNYEDTWVDNASGFGVWDDDESWTEDFYFRVYVGHNTPSDLYTHDSISGARIRLSSSFRDSAAGLTSLCEVQIYDNTGAAWVSVGELSPYLAARGTIITKSTIEIPANYIDDLVSATGIAQVRFKVTRGAGTTTLIVYYLKVEVDVETTAYSTALYIEDTGTNYLVVEKDMTAAPTCIWEGASYCITEPIHDHVGTLVTDGDAIYDMTAAANIESTTGISTRHFIERTRLEMLQELASEDAAVFYVPLGTVALTWKSTFNNGAPTAMTDASVLAWQGDWNYKSMFNEFHVQGAQIGDHQVSGTDSDATSILTYGISRVKAVKHSGMLTDHDSASLAGLLVDRNKDVKLYLEALLPGLSALRLGSEVSITSTYLGLAAQVYTVTHWAFDYANHRTDIRLHPRASTTGYQDNITLTQVRDIKDSQKATQADKYVPDLYTQEWA